MKLINMTPQERESLRLMKTMPSMRPFVEALRHEAAASMASLMTLTDEVALRRLQGKATFLHDLLSSIEKAD